MELGARIGTMARRGAPLPYDAEVEWISPAYNSKAYYDIGIQFGSSFSFETYLKETNRSYGDKSQLFGAHENNVGFSVYRAYNSSRVIVNGVVQSVFNLANESVLSGQVSPNKSIFTTADKTIEINSPFTPISKNIVVFKNNNYGLDNYWTRFFYLKLWDESGSLVLDLIPVKKSVNGIDEAFIYNKVNGLMIGKTGEGSISIGPDKTV